MNAVGELILQIERLFQGSWTALRNLIRNAAQGPLQGLIVALIIGAIGLFVVVEKLLKVLDGVSAYIERVLVVIATLGMTALVFNTYLIDVQNDWGADEGTHSSSETLENVPPPVHTQAPPPPSTPRDEPQESASPLATTSNGNVAVELTGSATEVSLSSDAGTFTLPGEVPAGAYTANARFDGRDAPAEAGSLDIQGPGPVTVKCDSFTEVCRVKKRRAPPVTAPATEPTKPLPEPEVARVFIDLSTKGDVQDVQATGEGEVIPLPGEVPPGNFILHATFPDVGKVIAGKMVVLEDAPFAITCDESVWHCVEDRGWWNIWAGDGQINLALMLMVAMGFLGASIATRQNKHLAVDATERVLSPGPARLVKRLTALVASGLCFILMHASWVKAMSPEANGSTFPGAKVWWWMVKPINWVTNLIPAYKWGPGSEFPTRMNWEDAMIDQGLETPYALAFSYVKTGDGFPLWIPVLFLVATFAIMGVRFASLVLKPRVGEIPQRVGSRRPADVILAGAFPGALIALGLAVWLGQAWMIVISSLLLVFLGSPLFIAIGVGTLAGHVLLEGNSATGIVNDMFEATQKQEIIAIPFFVLAGNIMTHGSIAKRLIGFAQALVGRLPGGLGVSAVLACAVFAAISGSSPATVIAIGSIMFPMLLKQGYSEKYSLGLLTTSGSLGIIIPPSVPMIIYAVMVSNPNGPVGIISPTELFKGGVLPGIFIAMMLVMYTFWTNWPRPVASLATTGGVLAVGPPPLPFLTSTNTEEVPDTQDAGKFFSNLLDSFVKGIPSLLLPVIVLGGIYNWFTIGGFSIVFDVTQASAIAVVYALFVELFVHRQLKLRDVPGVCIETASMIGSLFLILVIAISLNKLLVDLEVPQTAANWMLSYSDSPLTFLIMVNLFLLALGCVMDIISAILIVAPLLAPIAAQYGIHPIHFGIMFIVNLELGYLTPPMGINLFVASTTFGRSLVKVIRSIVPFLFLMLFSLIVIIWVPRIFESLTGTQLPGLPAFVEQTESPESQPTLTP